jgi:Holliday junction resolvase
MNNPIGEFSGEELGKILNQQVELHTKGITSKLQDLDPVDTFNKWHNIILSIEEFINIPLFGIDEKNNFEKILSTPLDNRFIGNQEGIKEVLEIVKTTFGEKVSSRFLKLMLMTAAINLAFKSKGTNTFGPGINLDTIGNAISYYQSRRRYFVTLLYVIPKKGKGTKRIEEIQLINELLPTIEFSCVGLTSINYQKILLELHSDFTVKSDGNKMTGSHQYQPLERLFNEPERISLIDQVIHRADQLKKFDSIKVEKNKIFSIPELRNSIEMIESAYSFYEIEESGFKIFKTIIYKLLESVSEDYFMSINCVEFDNIISFYSEKTQKEIKGHFLNKSNNYAINLNSYHPLIKVESNYISNLNLLMRFLYYFKNQILYKKKRFQIHSGFVFEDMIKKELSEKGFNVMDITRINRKEFDVVTTKDNVIHNFQCKNNSIDLSLIESKPKSFNRYNRYLIRYYYKALEKEENRENLLINKLNISNIKHYVISRFPVITTENRIISYNNLDRWIENNFT